VPRYFFHFTSKDEVIEDLVGVDLSDVREAHHYAVGLTARILARVARIRPGWVIKITDANGSPVLNVLMGEALRTPEASLWHPLRRSAQALNGGMSPSLRSSD